MKKIGVTADVCLFCYPEIEVTDEEYKEIKENGVGISTDLYLKIKDKCDEFVTDKIKNVDNLDSQIWKIENVDEDGKWGWGELEINFN